MLAYVFLSASTASDSRARSCHKPPYGPGLEKPFLYGWSLPAALVFIAALARHQRKTYYFRRKSKGVLASRFMLQSLPVAAAVLALAMALNAVIPTSFFHSRHFEGLVDDLSGQISSMQWNQVDFRFFPFSRAGYYLCDRLGGRPTVGRAAPGCHGTDDTFYAARVSQPDYEGQRWLQDLTDLLSFRQSALASEQDDTYV